MPTTTFSADMDANLREHGILVPLNLENSRLNLYSATYALFVENLTFKSATYTHTLVVELIQEQTHL